MGRFGMVNDDDIAKRESERILLGRAFDTGFGNGLLSMFDSSDVKEQPLLKIYMLSVHALGRDMSNFVNVTIWRKHLLIMLPDRYQVAKNVYIPLL